MFKQFFRLTFVTFIWKHYKRIIVSTLILFAFLWFVGYAHAEYLQFANEQAQANAQKSYFFKWAAQLLAVTIYLLFHYLMPSRKQQKISKQKAKNFKAEAPAPGEPDPFDAIRHKDKLRSRTEVMLNEKQD